MAPEATSHVPLTRPSHVSLFTGLYPAEHGIRDNVSPSLVAEVPTLAEVLQGRRLSTRRPSSRRSCCRRSPAWTAGFDTYADRFDAGGDDARFLNTIQKRGDATTAEAVAWLEAHRLEGAFVRVAAPLRSPRSLRAARALRHRATRAAPTTARSPGPTSWSGRLDAALARLGPARATRCSSSPPTTARASASTARRFTASSSTSRRCACRCCCAGPGIPAGTRLGVTARSVDLFPTVLDLAGRRRGRRTLKLSGRSLAAALTRGERPAEEAAYAESLFPLLHFGWSDLRVLREGRWKYIQAPAPELYDLQRGSRRDPQPRLVEPARAEALARGAQAASRGGARARPRAAGRGRGAPGPAREARRARLPRRGARGGGRVGRRRPEGQDRGVQGRQPPRARRAASRLRQKDYAGSVAALPELRRRGASRASRSTTTWPAASSASAAAGEAARRLRGGPRAAPGLQRGLPRPGRLPDRAGRAAAALAALRRGRRTRPGTRAFTTPRRRSGGGWGSPARRSPPTRWPRLAPKDALLRVQLGEAWRDRGDHAKAVAGCGRPSTLDPAPASYWNSLGMVLGAQRRARGGREGVPARRCAGTAATAQYAYNLGLAVLRQGRRDEAAALFRKALELDPRFAPARARLAEVSPRSR